MMAGTADNSCEGVNGGCGCKDRQGEAVGKQDQTRTAGHLKSRRTEETDHEPGLAVLRALLDAAAAARTSAAVVAGRAPPALALRLGHGLQHDRVRPGQHNATHRDRDKELSTKPWTREHNA